MSSASGPVTAETAPPARRIAATRRRWAQALRRRDARHLEVDQAHQARGGHAGLHRRQVDVLRLTQDLDPARFDIRQVAGEREPRLLDSGLVIDRFPSPASPAATSRCRALSGSLSSSVRTEIERPFGFTVPPRPQPGGAPRSPGRGPRPPAVRAAGPPVSGCERSGTGS